MSHTEWEALLDALGIARDAQAQVIEQAGLDAQAQLDRVLADAQLSVEDDDEATERRREREGSRE